MHFNYGPCDCPEPLPKLPAELCNAAVRGNVDQVIQWLSEGGDVNSSYGYGGWTLLGAACSGGHTALVEELLKYSDLHLNVCSMHDIALNWALEGGHYDCVELLLATTLKCRLDIIGPWQKILNYLKHEPKVWVDVVTQISSYWDFTKLAEIVKVKNKDFEVDHKLAKALLNKTPLEAKERLACIKDVHLILDGTLIVISAGETTEELAKMLVDQPHYFHNDSIESSLILACMNNHLGLLPVLLNKFIDRYSYAILNTAHQATVKAKHRNANRLLERALNVKCSVYMPSSEVRSSSNTVTDKVFNVVGHTEGAVAPLGEPEEVSAVPGIPPVPLGEPEEASAIAGIPPADFEVGTPAIELSGNMPEELAELAKEAIRKSVTVPEASEEIIAAATGKSPMQNIFSTTPLSGSAASLIKAAESQAKAAVALGLAAKSLALASKDYIEAPKSEAKESETQTRSPGLDTSK